MGFGQEKPGIATVLLRCRHNSAAKFERYKRARCQPGRESIPIPIPTPTPIQAMIGWIGHDCLEETDDGTRLFGGFSHRGHRVHREILPFAIDETTPTSAGLR